MTSPESEWSFPNAATMPGSGSYYAVRFSPAATRDLHAMQLAWYEVVQGIARQPSDPGVARLKLDWWHHEVDRGLLEQAPRHPLMTGLIAEGMARTGAQAMHAVIDAAEQRIRRPALSNAQAFHDACRGSGGNLFRMLCAAPAGSTYNTERAGALGEYWEAVTRLCQSQQDPAMVPETLRRVPTASASDDVHGAHYDILSRYPGSDTALRDEPVPDVARRLTAVALGLARRLARHRPATAGRPVDRTPLGHLWAAWRCR